MPKTDKTRRADAVPMRPPMKNPSRERMKAEIALLRDELTKLETTRRLLAKQRRKRVARDAAIVTKVSANSSVRPLTLIASDHQQELKKRRAAELENKRLREALSQQLETVKTMMTSLHAHGMLNVVWPTLERRPSLSNVLNDDNGYRFAALADSVDRIYRQVDEKIQFGRLDEEQISEFMSMLTSHKVDEEELLVIEGRETTVIPFVFEHCHNAMWKAIKEASWGESGKVFVHASTPDSFMLRVFSSHTVRGETVGMTVTRVVKRFVEDDRMIIVWRAVSSLDGHEFDSDVYVDESGWAVMQRASDEDKEEFVVKKVCSQWAPRSFSQFEDRAIAIQPSVNACTNVVLSSAVDVSTGINEMMENLLIDDCMSSQRTVQI